MKSRASAALFSAFVVLGTWQAVGNADTPKFPDIDSYTPVNAKDYTIELPNPGRAPTEKVFFATPDGLFCSFDPGDDAIAGVAGCTGTKLPGTPALGPYTSISTINGPQADTSTPFVDGAIQGHKVAVLPPLHSIAVSEFVCGVDDKGMTACNDTKGRGFLISPSWTGWLPKV